MKREHKLQWLSKEIIDLAENVIIDTNINKSDLRRVLSFLNKVLQVIDHSFQDVYTSLIEIQYLREEDIQSGYINKIARSIKGIYARSKFRDAEEICSRLHSLRHQYKDEIEPIIGHLNKNEWNQVFFLLDEREGYFITIIQRTVNELEKLLADVVLEQGKLKQLKAIATQKAGELQEILNEIQEFRNRILGLSGNEGFLKLTETNKEKLQDEIKIFIGGVLMKDEGAKYNISGGNIGAVGDNAKAENIIQYANNANTMPSIEINMEELLEELVKLKKELKNVLKPNETYVLDDIKNAINSANNEDKNQVVNSLKKAKDIITPYILNFGLSYLAGLLPKII